MKWLELLLIAFSLLPSGDLGLNLLGVEFMRQNAPFLILKPGKSAVNLITLFSCLPWLWLLIWTSQGSLSPSLCVFNIIAFCMWRGRLVCTWLLFFFLGSCRGSVGVWAICEQFLRGLGHLCLTHLGVVSPFLLRQRQF